MLQKLPEATVEVLRAHVYLEVWGGEPSDFWAITVPRTSGRLGVQKSPRSHFRGIPVPSSLA